MMVGKVLEYRRHRIATLDLYHTVQSIPNRKPGLMPENALE